MIPWPILSGAVRLRRSRFGASVPVVPAGLGRCVDNWGRRIVTGRNPEITVQTEYCTYIQIHAKPQANARGMPSRGKETDKLRSLGALRKFAGKSAADCAGVPGEGAGRRGCVCL